MSDSCIILDFPTGRRIVPHTGNWSLAELLRAAEVIRIEVEREDEDFFRGVLSPEWLAAYCPSSGQALFVQSQTGMGFMLNVETHTFRGCNNWKQRSLYYRAECRARTWDEVFGKLYYPAPWEKRAFGSEIEGTA